MCAVGPELEKPDIQSDIEFLFKNMNMIIDKENNLAYIEFLRFFIKIGSQQLKMLKFFYSILKMD